MSLQSVLLILGVVAAGSFCAVGFFYYVLRKTQSVGVWFPNGFVGAAPQSALYETLKKFLDQGIQKIRKVTKIKRRSALLHSHKGALGFQDEESHCTTQPLEAVVQTYEDYLNEIAAFQRQLTEAASVAEILNKTCCALSDFSRKARVVYLEYQTPQRALMVNSRSSPEVFARTQPKMFLPLGGAGKPVAVEELRALFTTLPRDAELQRLLRDSCLSESCSRTPEAAEVLASQAVWRIYPFYVRGIPQGAFALQENSHCQRSEFNNLVEIFLAHTAGSVENIRLHSTMFQVTAKDVVTGLESRRVFQERLEEAFQIARRLQHPLTLVRLDVDHMPAHVKQYGGAVSEAILRHVTRHLDRHFRKSDVVARFGQDGFAILMPHTALVEALKKVEQVVNAIRDSSLKLASNVSTLEIKATVSAGVAEFPSHADNIEDLLRLASGAVFRSHSGARASVTLAKFSTGYVAPFKSRYVRSSPKALRERVADPVP